MKNQILPITSDALESLPLAARKELIRISEVSRFEQKDVLLNADEYSEHVYFIAIGSLVSYVVSGVRTSLNELRLPVILLLLRRLKIPALLFINS